MLVERAANDGMFEKDNRSLVYNCGLEEHDGSLYSYRRDSLLSAG
jgi:hypothetical protein